MKFLILLNSNLKKLLIIQWIIIVVSISILGIGFSFDCINSSFLEFLKWYVLLLFIWSYFSFLFVGMPFYHPYRMFLLAFFAFLLGRILLDILGILNFAAEIFFIKGLVFSLSTQYMMLTLLILFLLFFQLGALIVYSDRAGGLKKSWSFNDKMFRIGKFLFWIWLLPALIYWHQYITYVLEHGYASLTANDQIISPNIIIRLGDDFFLIGFFLLLASKPEIKKLRWPTIIYIFLMLFTLLTGRRIFFFTQMLMIITYFGFRGNLSKKVVLFLGIIMVILAVVVGISRSITEFSLTKSVNYKTIGTSFLSTQGISVHAIGLTIDYVEKNQLSYDIRYLVEPFVNLYTQFGNSLGINSPKPITDNYFLGDRLSFIFNVDLLPNGKGLGSSLVAEFYIVGGMFGVVLGAVLMGMLLVFLVNKLGKSNFGMLFLLLILPLIFFSPRAHPLLPFAEAIKPVIIIVVVYFIDYILRINSVLNNSDKSK